MNLLYYGDNLDVLHRHVEGESVNLVYLDTTFNANASYHVRFAEHDGQTAGLGRPMLDNPSSATVA